MERTLLISLITKTNLRKWCRFPSERRKDKKGSGSKKRKAWSSLERAGTNNKGTASLHPEVRGGGGKKVSEKEMGDNAAGGNSAKGVLELAEGP